MRQFKYLLNKQFKKGLTTKEARICLRQGKPVLYSSLLDNEKLTNKNNPAQIAYICFSIKFRLGKEQGREIGHLFSTVIINIYWALIINIIIDKEMKN